MARKLKASERICLKGVSPQVLASLASPHSGSPHSPSESVQHAVSLREQAPEKDSHRLSHFWHSRGWKPISHRSTASTFLHPFAPQALPCFHATMDALTPARPALRTLIRGNEHQPLTGQVSLVHMTRTSIHSVTNHPARPAVASALPTQRNRLPEYEDSGLDFTMNELARRYARPNRVRHPTGCMFASGFPHLAVTVILATERHSRGGLPSQIAPVPRSLIPAAFAGGMTK
jgi:hypothetical protein